MQINKKNIAIIFLIASFLSVGCSSMKNTEETVENKNKITTENSENKNITFDELQKIAVNKLGKDSDTDGPSHYVTYTGGTISVNTDTYETAPDISELSKEEANNDIEKMEFLSQYYEFVKNEYDNFVEDIWVKDLGYEEFYKIELKHMDLIHKSYIEGKSKQALKAYLNTTLNLMSESSSICFMIDTKNDNNLSKEEKISRIKEENKQRSEVRSYSEKNLKDIYSNLDFK